MSKPTNEQIDAEVERAIKSNNVFLRGVYMILSSSFIFAVLGAIAGWAFALLLPGYFRNVYEATDSEIWQVAVGLGITRGFLLGVFLSSIVLLTTAWYRSRMKNSILQQYEQASN